MSVFNVICNEVVTFSEFISTNIKSGSIIDVFGYSESTSHNFKLLSIREELRFNDYGLDTGKILTRIIPETLIFTDTARPRVRVVSINDFLFIYDVLARPNWHRISEAIVFSDNFVVYASKALLPDTITFTDTAIYGITGDKTITETLTLSDGLAVVKIPDGNTGMLMMAMLNYTITLTSQDGEVLELPQPKFGDTETLKFKRLITSTRSGQPIIAGYPEWLTAKLFRMDFDNVPEKVKENARSFVKRFLGQPVVLFDHNGVTRTIIIQNPDREFAQIGQIDHAFSLDCYEVPA